MSGLGQIRNLNHLKITSTQINEFRSALDERGGFSFQMVPEHLMNEEHQAILQNFRNARLRWIRIKVTDPQLAIVEKFKNPDAGQDGQPDFLYRIISNAGDVGRRAYILFDKEGIFGNTKNVTVTDNEILKFNPRPLKFSGGKGSVIKYIYKVSNRNKVVVPTEKVATLLSSANVDKVSTVIDIFQSGIPSPDTPTLFPDFTYIAIPNFLQKLTSGVSQYTFGCNITFTCGWEFYGLKAVRTGTKNILEPCI